MARGVTHPGVDKIGLLGDDEGGTTLLFYEEGEWDPTGFELTDNQLRWLYEQLKAFCE